MIKGTFICWTLIAAIYTNVAVPDDQIKSAHKEAVIVFVHGRGQDTDGAELLRKNVYDVLRSGLKHLYGEEVVPVSDLRFVWYADAIDPNADALPTAPDCQFFSIKELGFDLAYAIRDGLMAVATKAGADKFGLKVLATDTYNYLAHPTVRCDADARLTSELKSEYSDNRKVVLVAHSMGGIVAFSSLSRLNSIPHTHHPVELITIGTQVGLKEVQQGLSGSFVELPVPIPQEIHSWINFQNAGDMLAFPAMNSFTSTDPQRRPYDRKISQTGERHAMITYLANPDVLSAIAKAWCRSTSPSPQVCKKVLQREPVIDSGESFFDEKYIDGILDQLSVFNRMPKPTFDFHGPATQASQPNHITVDLRQLKAYQDVLGEDYAEDIALFMLAHESAHLARTTYLPIWKPSMRTNECNADIWAGAALINQVLGMRPPTDTISRVRRIVELGSDAGGFMAVGSPEFRGASYQPRIEQRALCVTRGVNMGLQLWRIAHFKRSENPVELNEITEICRKDPSMLGVDDDPWQWSKEAAIDIVSESPKQLDHNEFNIDVVLTLAEGAVRGRQALRQRFGIQKFNSPYKCVYEIGRVICTSSELVSEAISYIAFDTWRGQLQYSLLPTGWTDIQHSTRTGELVEKYAKGAAQISLEADLKNHNLVLSVVAN